MANKPKNPLKDYDFSSRPILKTEMLPSGHYIVGEYDGKKWEYRRNLQGFRIIFDTHARASQYIKEEYRKWEDGLSS